MAAALTLGPESLPRGPSALLPVEPGGSIDAGRVVEIRFRDLPDDVGELEILLEGRNPDGAIAVRLTERLDPRRRYFLWTVPNLPVAAATLRLRTNRGGREIEGPQSAPFAIAPVPGAAPALLAQRDGEIWVEEETEADEDARVPIEAMTAGTQLSPLPSENPAAVGVSAPALRKAPMPSAADFARRSRTLATPRPVRLTRVPLSIPARI